MPVAEPPSAAVLRIKERQTLLHDPSKRLPECNLGNTTIIRELGNDGRFSYSVPHRLATSCGRTRIPPLSKTHNKYFQFKSYHEGNKWLIDRLIHDPKLGHKLAPETVKGRPELLKKVGIVNSKVPRLSKPYPGLFDFSVRPID
jgi:hypothetical protein